jgi:hypothetical protein
MAAKGRPGCTVIEVHVGGQLGADSRDIGDGELSWRPVPVGYQVEEPLCRGRLCRSTVPRS